MKLFTVWLIIIFCNGCTGCGEGCTICLGISQKCHECKVGYWLYNSDCQPCPDTCRQCSYHDKCSVCTTNFWGTDACDKKCTESCDESGCNDVTGHCFTCRPGLYGDNCLKNCTLCKDGMCHRIDGQCINGCIDGYYEDTANTNKTCRKCSEKCKLCESRGSCSECDKGFYTLSYESSPGEKVTLCYTCNPSCEECDTGNDCTVCKPGKYGPLCQNICSDSLCRRCNKADGVEQCTECDIGYKLHGNTCVPEITCSDNCVSGCDEKKLCVGGCKDGLSGQTCTKQCASHCQKCQFNNSDECTMCKGDLYSFSCNISCDVHCSRIDFEQTCRLKDGFCLNGCTDGYWGDKCNNSCSIGCNSTQCSRTEGYCETCRRKFYGSACHHACSEHCYDDGSTLQVCRKIDGRCTYGCNSGYSGYSCEYLTSSCLTTVPTADRITERTDAHCSQPDTTGLETKSLVLGIVIGVGISLTIAAVTGLFCFLRRRQRLTSDMNTTMKNAEQKDYKNTAIDMKGMPSAENQPSDQTALEASPNVYERLQDKYDDQQQYTELGGLKG